MGGIVTKRGTFGLWGRNLYVSTPEAQQDNVEIWGVPAENAAIEYVEAGDKLAVDEAPPLVSSSSSVAAGETPPPPPSIRLSGWRATRSDERLRLSGWEAVTPIGGLPVMWTPTIKVLWAPVKPLPPPEGANTPLPTRSLRLSASSLAAHWCPQGGSEQLGVPIPLGLSVDGLKIEIGDPCGDDL